MILLWVYHTSNYFLECISAPLSDQPIFSTSGFSDRDEEQDRERFGESSAQLRNSKSDGLGPDANGREHLCQHRSKSGPFPPAHLPYTAAALAGAKLGGGAGGLHCSVQPGAVVAIAARPLPFSAVVALLGALVIAVSVIATYTCLRADIT